MTGWAWFWIAVGCGILSPFLIFLAGGWLHWMRYVISEYDEAREKFEKWWADRRAHRIAKRTLDQMHEDEEG